jgi:hypothetical protein
MIDILKKIPVSEITSSKKTGFLRVYKDYWWAVTEDDCVLIYIHHGSNTPQCNINRQIAERVLCKDVKTIFLAPNAAFFSMWKRVP